MVNSGDGKPIASVYPIFKDLSAELQLQTDRLHQTIATELAAFNAEAKRAGVAEITGK